MIQPHLNLKPVEKLGRGLAPALKVIILGLICCIAFFCRIFSVLRYESIIHEFDPWFNYRLSKILVDHGYYAFINWIDKEVWYPLGRPTGNTLYPGLMLTSWTFHNVFKLIGLPLHIREVCVFMGPIFSAAAAIAAYLLTVEITHESKSGLISALFMATTPSFISRSFAGDFDNECIAIFALIFAFYFFLKTVNSGSMMDGLGAALAYYYLVLNWGGYVFVLGVISLFVIGLVITNRFNFKVYIAFTVFYCVGNMLTLCLPFISTHDVWRQVEHIFSHLAFLMIQVSYLIQFIRKNLTKKKFRFFIRSGLFFGILGGGLAVGYLVLTGKIKSKQRINQLLNPTYAKQKDPLIRSISEHNPTPWGRFWFSLQYLLFLAPVGAYVLLRKPRNPGLFIGLFSILSIYFTSIMLRIMLIAAPAMCVLGGIGSSYLLEVCADVLREDVNKIIFWIRREDYIEIGSEKSKEVESYIEGKLEGETKENKKVEIEQDQDENENEKSQKKKNQKMNHQKKFP